MPAEVAMSRLGALLGCDALTHATFMHARQRYSNDGAELRHSQAPAKLRDIGTGPGVHDRHAPLHRPFVASTRRAVITLNFARVVPYSEYRSSPKRRRYDLAAYTGAY
jgi:hypothetical protein